MTVFYETKHKTKTMDVKVHWTQLQVNKATDRLRVSSKRHRSRQKNENIFSETPPRSS